MCVSLAMCSSSAKHYVASEESGCGPTAPGPPLLHVPGVSVSSSSTAAAAARPSAAADGVLLPYTYKKNLTMQFY